MTGWSGTVNVYSLVALAWAPPSPGCDRGVHPSDKSVVIMKAKLERVELLAFSADGWRVALGDGNGKVEVWELHPYQRLRAIESPSQVLTMAFSPDGQQLATSSADGKISVWEVSGDELISSFDVAGGPVYSIGYAPDASQIAAGCKDGVIQPRRAAVPGASSRPILLLPVLLGHLLGLGTSVLQQRLLPG